MSSKRLWSYGKNIYILATLVFLVWMSFFDENSWLFTHAELNNQIKDLEQQKTYLQEKIVENQNILQNLKSKDSLEAYARETYYLNKPDEETYIIKYDTIKEVN